MLVSWEWLSQYVDLNMEVESLVNQLALSGLNHESTTKLEDDWAIDLEVTSNRGDCLSHLGIAREVSVLYKQQLRVPTIELSECTELASDFIQVENRFKSGCPNYSARIIRGVKVGPSPAWLSRRLKAIGVHSVNNIVDVTNYVMFECGQPLHAFDLSEIAGNKIIVREAEAQENFTAIDHRTYVLPKGTVVIADAQQAVALGGIMGGVLSEVRDDTVDLLIEAADFQPMHIRQAARTLKLHSPSSHRFERKVDPVRVDWASRRCCQLILQVAGGKLLHGVVSDGTAPDTHQPITLRHAQIKRVLGIHVPWSSAIDILVRLGCHLQEQSEVDARLVPPSWRHDLTREVDLIEEVARIFGYDKIPEDVPVPITVSMKRDKDVLVERVRSLANATGLDEVMTPSVVTADLDSGWDAWTKEAPLRSQTPLLEGANLLRRSLVPSLLQVRRFNQSHGFSDGSFFETSTCYLPSSEPGQLPTEKLLLGVVTNSDFRKVRGLFESILARCTQVRTALADYALRSIASDSGQAILAGDRMIAWFGVLDRTVRDRWKFDADLAVGELDLGQVMEHFCGVPQLKAISAFPSIKRDLNIIFPEATRWSKIASIVGANSGDWLSELQYVETYRDSKKDGHGRKRILFSMEFQSSLRTLTSEEVDELVGGIVRELQRQLNGELL